MALCAEHGIELGDDFVGMDQSLMDTAGAALATEATAGAGPATTSTAGAADATPDGNGDDGDDGDDDDAFVSAESSIDSEIDETLL